MSYESYLDSELKLAGIELESGERERLVNIFKIIDEQGHSGGSISILLPIMRNELERDIKAPQPSDAPEIFNADTFAEGLSKPVFQELNGLTLNRAIVVAELALKAVGFIPFTPLTGEDDEWFEPFHDTLQNKRMGAVFKDPETGKAYWLDANRLNYPSAWNDHATWSAYGRRGFLKFPFDPSVGTTDYYYTTESLRHHIVVDPNPNRAFLTQAMLTTAAGGAANDVLLSPVLETVGPDVGKSLIAAFTEFWGAVIDSEDLANAKSFPYNAHHVALNGLRHATEYEVDSDKPNNGKPDNVTVFGLNVPYEAIPHLARMVSFLPESTYVKEGRLVHPYDDNLTGQFVAVPVFTVSEDSQRWEQLPDLVTVIWNDSLVLTGKVNIVTADRGVEIVSGDEDDWLWRFRDRHGIAHPERKSTFDGALNEAQAVASDGNLTDPADVIDPDAPTA